MYLKADCQSFNQPDDITDSQLLIQQLMMPIRLKSSVYFDSQLHGEWGMDIGKSGFIQFHCVAQGECWLKTACNTVQLNPGDVALCLRGQPHTLSVKPGLATISDQQYLTGLRQGRPLFREGIFSNQLLCGHFEISAAASIPLLSALPDLLVISAPKEGVGWAHTLRQLLLGIEAFGSSTLVYDRFSEAVFLRLILAYYQQSDMSSGILAAFQDRRLARALNIFHQHDTLPTSVTVTSVAEQAGLSRSAFCVLFKKYTGISPGDYLNHQRLNRGRELLLNTRFGITDIADQAGYLSEAAFSRAFKRMFGVSPGEYRRLQNAL